MSGAGACDDDIGLFDRTARAIRVADFDLRPRRKRSAGALGKRRIDLDGADFARATNKLRQDRRIVTGPATEVEHSLSRAHIQLVEHEGPKAGLTIVEPTRFIQGNQHVVV